MTINEDVRSILQDLYADELIEGLNVVSAITLTTRTAGAYNATTGTQARTETAISLNAIVRQIQAHELRRLNEGASEQFNASDRVFMIGKDQTGAPSGITTGDSITFVGVRHEILKVEETRLGADALQWTVYARRLSK